MVFSILKATARRKQPSIQRQVEVMIRGIAQSQALDEGVLKHSVMNTTFSFLRVPKQNIENEACESSESDDEGEDGGDEDDKRKEPE